MKQIIQSFKTGETLLEDIPAPQVRRGTVLIRSTHSLVSLGTERMLVEFGKSSLISKARQQPEKVKQVLDKIKSDGLLPTLEAVFNKLEQPLPLGYCNVGEVIAVGEGVSEFKVGDRVASNGSHAEIVCVPQNLVAAIPDNVSNEEAVFTVIGSIGLQGIRLCDPTLGETIVVVGLGLIGLITAELLVANGCRVIGVDIDEQKLAIAREKGILTCNPLTNDSVSFVEQLTGIGADGVIITASAKNNDIISQAARMSRKRGRIILVGVIGLNISRAEFYEKELSFQVSCSYGPGRYDENYEQRGQDYPLPFVRWTEKRNFETILQAIATQKLNVRPLITEQIAIADFQQIYGNIGTSRSIASILVYPATATEQTLSKTIIVNKGEFKGSKGVVGIVGAGNFTKMTLMPLLKKTNAGLSYIASAGGVTGTALAKKYGFVHSTTDYKEILADNAVDLVMITTRHDQHASMVCETLKAGKHVFVEKPLAISAEQLQEVIQTKQELKREDLTISLGFNRRFSPHIQKMKSLLGNSDEQLNIIATMNAGSIPANVWVQDMLIGGGRIIGEGCHYMDLMVFLTGSKIQSVCINAMGTNPMENTDNASILLKFENGSTGVLNYFSNGNKSYSKERVEVYSRGRNLIMDNFRKTEGFGFNSFSKLKTTQDKGHAAQFKLLIDRIKNGGEPLIPFDEIINVTKASFAAIESLKTGNWVVIK